MTITDFQTITDSNFQTIMTSVRGCGKSKIAEFLKQLDPYKHDIADKEKRPDKIVNTGSEEDGEKRESAANLKRVTVARIPLALQKQIASRAAAFLCGNPIEYVHAPLTDAQQPFFDVFDKVIDDNKINFKNIELAYKMASETQVAEIWYPEKVTDKDPEYWAESVAYGADYRLRMKIVAASLGDELFPVFDELGDMIAFGRGYKMTVGDKTHQYFEIYTALKTFKANNSTGSWKVAEEANPIGKIPVILYCQELPEWSDVQPLIERLEICVSNNADTVDYNGSPILLAYGNVTGFSDKGEQGKLLQIQGQNGKVEYLTWDNAPEAVKNEIEFLLRMVYNLTDTPNISLEEMKSVNTFSGVALKMLFLAAHMKAASKAGTFGESVQRRINLIKTAIAKLAPKAGQLTKIKIEPKFKYFLPENTAEMIDILSKAVYDKPVMSQETAVALNPLVTDAKKEMETVKKETEEANASLNLPGPNNLNLD